MRKWEFDLPEFGVLSQKCDEVLCSGTLRETPESALVGKNCPDFLQLEDVRRKFIEVLDDVRLRDLDS
ncbi:hypothetical protein GTC3P0254_56960 [Burkholderia pseudomallei]|nr:hypothetical protein BpKM376_59110 [Burkholderia pseudomallei]BEH58746.1 hypothetical protein BpKM376_59250 [Burkholderia pseudomallei]GEA58719.1 hypothetical protein GTC3P0254_56960 [Burkholderia pseudomallei]